MPFLSGVDAARNAVLRIAPIAIIPYFDVVGFGLFGAPVSPEEETWLRRQCGGVWIERYYRRSARLTQPFGDALRWLATRRHYLNYAEPAMDSLFDSKAERETAYDLVDSLHWKRWPGNQEVFRYERTRYTGSRRAANRLVSYDDRPCRITGDPWCLHGEWRLTGVDALRGVRTASTPRGIWSIDDLLQLDPRQFWSERLLLRAVDADKLQRARLRWCRVHRRADPWPQGIPARTQDLIRDARRHQFDLRGCLVPLDVRHLLPSSAPMPDDDSTALIIHDRWSQIYRTEPNPLPPRPFTPSRPALAVSAEIHNPHRAEAAAEAGPSTVRI
jgi:hypothetical protein